MGLEKLAELKKQLAKESIPSPSHPVVRMNKTKPASPLDPVVLIIGRLQKAYPVAFPKNPSPKVALKVGILDDLNSRSEELGISKENLQLALKTCVKVHVIGPLSRLEQLVMTYMGIQQALLKKTGPRKLRRSRTDIGKQRKRISIRVEHSCDSN